jgi:hypothetical protein
LKLDSTGAGKGSRPNHLLGYLNVTLVVITNFSNDEGQAFIRDNRVPDGESALGRSRCF